MSDFGQTTRRLCSFGITALAAVAVRAKHAFFALASLFQKTSIGLENSKKYRTAPHLIVKLRFISIASERVVAGGDDTGHWRGLGRWCCGLRWIRDNGVNGRMA